MMKRHASGGGKAAAYDESDDEEEYEEEEEEEEEAFDGMTPVQTEACKTILANVRDIKDKKVGQARHCPPRHRP